MVNTEIRLIIFFVAKDGEVLYSEQKQDQELTMAQTMSSLLPKTFLYSLIMALVNHSIFLSCHARSNILLI